MPILYSDLEHSPENHDVLVIATIGDKLERALRDPTSPFSAMMSRAQQEYVSAVRALVYETELPRIQSLQAQARRYEDLCVWINDAMEAAGVADDDLASETGDEAIEQLKDMQYGNRDKPADDA